MATSMTIGQLAKATGVNVETVRFYERRGLIRQPPQRPSGYRQYSPDAVRRMQFVQRSKELGFSLKEIAELLDLRVSPGSSCADVKRQAQAKIAEIEKKMRDLERMKRALRKLEMACSGRGPTSQCPLLDALEGAKA